MPQQKLTKRADGRYMVSVYIGTIDGKKKYKSVYGKTIKEANEKALQIKNSLNKGIDLSGTDATFGKWCEYFLNNKKSSLTESRYKLVETQLNVWNNALKSCRIDRIRPLDLQPIVDRIAKENPYTGRPSAQYTVKTYINIIKAIFEFAIDNRAVEFNPAKNLTVPRDTEPATKRRALTKAEQQIICSFRHRGRLAMMLMMLTGLRKGEATALQWSDVNFKSKELNITKSYDFKNKCFKAPKNGKSRTVTIPDLLIEELKSVPKSSVFVLTNTKGQMMSDQSWKLLIKNYLQEVNRYCQENGLPTVADFSYHCLRHTYATILHSAKVDVLTASKLLGHSNPQITLDIYTHLEEDTKKASISELNSFLNSYNISQKTS